MRFPSLSRRAVAAAALLALAAGCARDRAEPAADADAPARQTETSDEARQPEPEETRVLRERLREESRAALPDDAPPSPRPPATPAVGSYEECMRQAAESSDPEERRLLEEPCPMLPGAPR